VVVRDFDLVGISSLPAETDTILIVDPDALLSRSVAAEPLQPIPRRNGKLQEIPNSVDLIELSSRHRPQIPRTGSPGGRCVGAVEEILGSSIAKRAYHGSHYNGMYNTSQLSAARGPIATVEIGVEVKILAKPMIKQIDRVINDPSRSHGPAWERLASTLLAWSDEGPEVPSEARADPDEEGRGASPASVPTPERGNERRFPSCVSRWGSEQTS
jgi:hypothetical protein